MGCASSAPPPDEEAIKKSKEESAVTDKAFAENMKFLGKVPLFKRLPKDQHPKLAEACVAADFEAGAVIITQGDIGEDFFVIRTGEASVAVNGQKVVSLKSGDYFGENALLQDEPRAATITADSAMTTLKINREKFQELGLNKKLQFANRKAVGGGDFVKAIATKPPSPKTKEEEKLIIEALRGNQNLQTMINLSDASLQQMVDVAWKEEVPNGKELITEGDLNADYFYVVQEGSFEIYLTEQTEVNQKPRNSQLELQMMIEKPESESKLVSKVTKGGSFGELALLYLVPRAATVKATSDSVVWVIDRHNFKNILMKVSDQKTALYAKYLDGVTILDVLLAEEKAGLAQALVETQFTKDQKILKEGDPGQIFYILVEGEIAVLRGEKEVKKLAASPDRQQAQFFGEKALLSTDSQPNTVQVASATAKALALHRDDFNMLLGPLEDIMAECKNPAGRGSRNSSLLRLSAKEAAANFNPHDKPRDKILRKDLDKVALLGAGAFGAVELYEHKTTKETYAMKSLNKGQVLKLGNQEKVMHEKYVMMMVNSPFIIKLFECYNGEHTLYFLMEPAMGGELAAVYQKEALHGKEKHAKFYSAGVVNAFQHMHERKVIYRDLKPENLLLSNEGQLKVTDFGLAKFVIGKTFTTCGTPDYFAPEVIAGTGHTNAVDWYTLGILLFELLSGNPPYFSPMRPMDTHTKAMAGIGKVWFPWKCQGSVGNLIKGLSAKDPSARLAMLPGGIQNVRDHKWYEGFDWDAFKFQSLDPPYVPVMKDNKDTSGFDLEFVSVPRQIAYQDDGTGWDADFATST